MERPALRQLAQRITARYHLRPFTFRETQAYVRHRLQIAGQRQMIFTPVALRLIHQRSGGVARLINNVCDRALLGAFGRTKRRVTAGTARQAALEVSGSAGIRRWLQPAAAAVLVAAVVMTAGALGTSRLGYVTTWWAQRLLPSGVAPSNAAIAVAPVATVVAPPRPSPMRLLDATTADREAALASLFTRWGVEFQPRPGEDSCEIARRAGLRCLVRSGTWNLIRRLDVPAVLTLTTPTGERHYATVTALGADTVTLDGAPRPVTLPLNEVERFWDGAFVALWRTPDLAATELKAGDDQRRRVVAFQRANGLKADGVLGEETLLRLATTAAGVRPSLSKATP